MKIRVSLLFAVCLTGIFAPSVGAKPPVDPAVSKNTVILLIRHAEKPDSGTGLAPDGEKRAQAYVSFFSPYHLGAQPLTIDALFAATDSEGSARPRLTITPLSTALKLPLNTGFDGKGYDRLAKHLRADEYKGKTVVICWKHGEILDLAQALGVKAEELPASAHWPAEWPIDQYDWLLQIVRDEAGAIDPAKTLRITKPALNLKGTDKQIPER